jgi:hypothetical protein
MHRLVVALGAMLVACIPVELAINRRIGAKMEVYLTRTDWTDEGCVLRWTAVNASSLRSFEPLLVLDLEGRHGTPLDKHDFTLPKMTPGDRHTLDLHLSAKACEELTYIDIVKACNLAPSFCSPNTCQYSDQCTLVTSSGLPYEGVTIMTKTLHSLPSYVEVGIEPELGSLIACLVPADEEARAKVLSSRPWRCGTEPAW